MDYDKPQFMVVRLRDGRLVERDAPEWWAGKRFYALLVSEEIIDPEESANEACKREALADQPRK